MQIKLFFCLFDIVELQAYKNVVKKNGAEKRLPGLPYTPDQLFFIGSSQVNMIVTL